MQVKDASVPNHSLTVDTSILVSYVGILFVPSPPGPFHLSQSGEPQQVELKVRMKADTRTRPVRCVLREGVLQEVPLAVVFRLPALSKLLLEPCPSHIFPRELAG